MHSIGNSMTALYGLPGIELLGIGSFVLGSGPADGGRIKEYLGPHQSRDTGSLGIPLVPADEYADAGIFCLEYLITQVAGSKIEFFVIGGIIGNMHFPVLAQVGPI